MNTKRFTAALLALLLCAALLTACAMKPAEPSAEPTVPPQVTAAAEAAATPELTAAPEMPAAADPTATAEPTSAPTPAPLETTAAPTGTAGDKNGLYDALCDLFYNYHVGTAGSSLTGARIAATILDFSIANGLDAVRSGAAAFDLGDQTEFGETFSDKLAAMYEIAMGFYGENGRALLSDSGYTPAHYPYSAKDVRDTYTAIFAARGYEAPAVVRVYLSDATAEHFMAFGVRLEGSEITAEALNGAMDGVVFQNGAAFNSVASDGAGHIRADLNDAFAAQVRSYGTTGEFFLLGGVVNTLLDAFDGTDVTITVNGAPLETGHNIYDTALARYEEW